MIFQNFLEGIEEIIMLWLLIVYKWNSQICWIMINFCVNFQHYLPSVSVGLNFCSSYVADRLNFPSSCEHTQLRRDVPCPIAVYLEMDKSST
jgi:hypothetical protein